MEDLVRPIEIDNWPITKVWMCSVGNPNGVELTLDMDSEDPEEYCDSEQIEDFLESLSSDWQELTGEKIVTKSGAIRWQWDGNAKIYDLKGNSVLNLVIWFASEEI